MKKPIVFLFLISIFFINAKKPKVPEFSIKEIEKSVARINDSIYAGKYEVSNFLYTYFLKDLKANNKTELLKYTQIDSSGWLDRLMFLEPFATYYHKHPAYANYPVVNISYEGVNLFCNWLTENYNKYPKRKFKKVIFRLPTEKEWKIAARGGLDMCPFPWGGPYLRNSKGEFLCNFRHVDDACVHYNKETRRLEIGDNQNSGVAGNLNSSDDITAPVNSYPPNNFGLYNMSGNAAEMINEKGITKGGSWRSPGGDVIIDKYDNYLTSSKEIGFRYFMEIVEM